MGRLEDLLFEALLGIAKRASGRTIFVLSWSIYLGLGLAMPLALQWSVPWLVLANVWAATVAGLLGFFWFALQVRAANARHLVEWTTDLRLLDSAEFEWLVGELFRREGWHVEEVGGRGVPDGNIDLELTRSGTRRIVQCKRWTSWLVGVDEVRSFAGTLLREALPGSSGVFVTLSDFSPQAREEAKRIGLDLIDNEALYRRVERARRTEPCPLCGASMLLDRSSRGWWLRCVAPGCVGKRDLGADPVRALELLTEPPDLKATPAR